MATAQEVLDTAARLGWLEPSPAPKGCDNPGTYHDHETEGRQEVRPWPQSAH